MQHDDKIKSVGELAEICESFKAEDEAHCIVHCHGVFDLVHIGHIRYFNKAKQLGDILIVTITPDRFVNKGPHRPAFTEKLRAEVLASLDCIDYVAINDWPTAAEAIGQIKPHVYAKGSEYKTNRTDEIEKEEAVVAEVGGQMAFIKDITSSSTTLVNRHLVVFSDEVKAYLNEFGGKYSIEDVHRCIDDLAELKVAVLGDTIIDEYHYCQAIGKSSKEPVLAAKYVSEETFAGGVLAIGNHLAGFADSVDLLTLLGTQDSYVDFITENLDDKIRTNFIYKDESPTIVKRRFLDSYFMSKFFEVYVIDDRELNAAEAEHLSAQIDGVVKSADVAIIADYGHGMFGPEVVKQLCTQDQFLAVNTQVNAGNMGFNTISKYPRADFICLNEMEIRLETRSRKGDLKEIVANLSQDLSCRRILVTRGKFGNLCYDADEGFFEVPAFASQVVDRVGAGDAVLSVASLCAATGAPMELVGFVANVVGAEATAIVGNRSSIGSEPLKRHITSLLK